MTSLRKKKKEDIFQYPHYVNNGIYDTDDYDNGEAGHNKSNKDPQ